MFSTQEKKKKKNRTESQLSLRSATLRWEVTVIRTDEIISCVFAVLLLNSVYSLDNHPYLWRGKTRKGLSQLTEEENSLYHQVQGYGVKAQSINWYLKPNEGATAEIRKSGPIMFVQHLRFSHLGNSGIFLETFKHT